MKKASHFISILSFITSSFISLPGLYHWWTAFIIHLTISGFYWPLIPSPISLQSIPHQSISPHSSVCESLGQRKAKESIISFPSLFPSLTVTTHYLFSISCLLVNSWDFPRLHASTLITHLFTSHLYSLLSFTRPPTHPNEERMGRSGDRWQIDPHSSLPLSLGFTHHQLFTFIICSLFPFFRLFSIPSFLFSFPMPFFLVIPFLALEKRKAWGKRLTVPSVTSFILHLFSLSSHASTNPFSFLKLGWIREAGRHEGKRKGWWSEEWRGERKI